MDMIKEIWDSLSRNKFRTAMTGFAIAWGIFILVVLLGASSGLENGIKEAYGSQVDNTLEVWAGWTSMPYNGLKLERSLSFTDQEAELVRNLPEVARYSSSASKWRFVTYNSNYTNTEIKGIESDWQYIMRRTVVRGRFINALDLRGHAKVAVVNDRLIDEINNGNSDIVGQFIKIGNINFKIVGVSKSESQWESATAYIPLTTHQTIYSPNRHFDHMAIQLRNDANGNPPTGMDKRMRTLLSPSMQFHPDDQRAIGVWDKEESYRQQQGVMSAIQLFILIIGICTLISGAVGVSNIMLVSVRERTKEFGIRKAIGAGPKTIIGSVVGESLLITGLFGCIGMLIGSGVVKLINMLLPANAEGFARVFRNPTVDMPTVLTATAILIIIGVIAGFIPARNAVKIKPIEAMNADK